MTSNQDMDLIVSASWLADHLNDPDLVIVDVRPEDAYAAGHIPGARNVDIYPYKILESDTARVDAWVRVMEGVFQKLGVSHDSRVVFYEDISGTSAARGVWLMHALSIGQGAMLDGGLAEWLRAGNPLSTAPAQPEPSDITATLNTDLFATADEILEQVQDESTGGTIIDTRADLEWMQGTIPTARHLEWTNHLNPDGTFKSIDELRDLYEEFGLERDERAITFCASGYRAAHTWLVLTMLGYGNVSNYAPSWGEWGHRNDLPVAPTR